MINFNASYDKDQLKAFFRDQFFPLDYQPMDQPVDLFIQTQYIRQMTLLGTYAPWDLNVYEIRHDSPNDPRVSLTRETFRLMKQFGHTDVLAIYTSPQTPNYRLSYVTLGYLPDDKKVKIEYSNPRRYSYFLGPDARIHTPSRYLTGKGHVTNSQDLKERFSVEVVNKDFYREIASLFTRLVGGKRQEGNKTSEYPALLILPSVTDHKKMQEFTVRMIGRIVFCWFLKKKSSPGGIPLIPEEILSMQSVKDNPNYYHTILEKLFFQVLNTPHDQRDDEFKAPPFAQIPFLNGGLFEPHKIDDYYKEIDPFTGLSKYFNTLKIPDQWMMDLFQLLETYNFTIDENTSMDVELSVDPEMLGRIFENLLAEINPETGETARKSTGSYYTPRPIVEYMVDESLKQYLKTQTHIPENKLDQLLSFSLDLEEVAESERITPEEKQAIIDAIDRVRIIDPACGSGAFPMGVLQKLVLVLEKVDPDSKIWLEKHLEKIPYALKSIVRKSLEKENVNYTHKMGLIRDAIYGVDIQQIAVEISKLRVFLSLIVDVAIDDTVSDNNRGIKPLPNLEFKFVCADSLMQLPQEEGKTKSKGLFEDRSSIKELKHLREQYFDSFGSEKEKIKKEFKQQQDRMFNEMLAISKEKHLIGEETQALSAWDPFSDKSTDWFDPVLMFGVKSGFDIIISNPPYIRQELLGDQKAKFKEQYRSVYHGVADIYIYFIENGMNYLLNENGIYCIIVANKWMRANYGEPLRKFLKNKQLIKLVDFGDLPVFQNTTTYPCILIATNSDQPQPFHACTMKTLEFSNLKNHIENLQIIIKPDQLQDNGWTLVDEQTYLLMEKIKKAGVTLDSYIGGKIFYGIKTGYNEAFIIDEATKNQLIAEDPSSAELIKPFLAGRDIKRYKKLISDQYLIFTKQGIDIKKYPAIEKHLLKYKDRLMPKPKKHSGNKWNGRASGTYEWYEIQATISYFMEFEKPKILLPDFSLRGDFAIDTNNFYCTNTVYMICSAELYLLGLLNSNLMTFFYRKLLSIYRGGYLRFFTQYLVQLPIKKVDFKNPKEKQQYDEITLNVEKMLELQQMLKDASNNDETEHLNKKIQDLDNQIDRLVYQIYDLTEEEIAIIENETGEKNK